MKKILLLTFMLFSAFSYSQETEYKEYSYSELFKMIEEEQDSVFTLSDALIIPNIEIDSLFIQQGVFNWTDSIHSNSSKTITVNKHLIFKNVQFKSSNTISQGEDKKNIISFGILKNIDFKKSVTLDETISLTLTNCTFHGAFNFKISNQNLSATKALYFKRNRFLIANSNQFYSKVSINIYSIKTEDLSFYTLILNNKFHIQNNGNSSENIYIRSRRTDYLNISKNIFIGEGDLEFYSYGNAGVNFSSNNFLNSSPFIQLSELKESDHININSNKFNKFTRLSIQSFYPNHNIDWLQFKEKVFSQEGYNSTGSNAPLNIGQNLYYSEESINSYFNNIRYKNDKSYKLENTLKGQFYTHYKEKMDNEFANMVYTELKDLETQRSGYLYTQNPSFEAFFTWKINQFLKVFSTYGTKPARAVIFSFYVILFFAFIYLLFPNSWDSLGKKRLIHRFEFFQKYLRRKDGMHTIYLEENAQEISSYEDFKTNLESSKTELPSFFITWSKPLYNASMFSSRLTSRFLKNTDILKGKWTDLSPKQKRWKNIQIGLLLTLGLLYDLFIKALNALMLSINTFTTLGFGEIPIKGLPRYLAIIQGFIGWFMLTIFSVSLISQLLN